MGTTPCVKADVHHPRRSPPQTFTTSDVHPPRRSPPQTFTTPFVKSDVHQPHTFTTPFVKSDVHHPRRSPPSILKCDIHHRPTFTTPYNHHPQKKNAKCNCICKMFLQSKQPCTRAVEG